MAAQPIRIVVGFDGTRGSRRALEAAARLMGYGSTMTVVNVATKRGNGSREVLREARELLLEHLVSASYLERLGEPGGEIVDAATEIGADLIVVGRRGPEERSGTLPGSVSADVLRRASCDVLVVS